MKNKLVIEVLAISYNKVFGLQEYIFSLLNYFKECRSRIDFEEIVVVCKDCDKQVLKQFAPELTVYGIDIVNTIQKYYVLNTIPKRLQLKETDVILYTNNYSGLFKHCKHILVIHDLLYLRKEYIPQFFFRFQRHLFVPRSVKIADKIIGISEWVKNDIIEQFNISDVNKVVAISHHININKFCEGEPSQYIVDVCKEKKFFLVVCAGSFHKNTITTIKAYSEYKLSKQGKEKLFLLGSGNKQILEYIEGLDETVKRDIVFLERISKRDLGYLYEHASAYISATLFEGFGMPIVEAICFGLPCLVSDIPVVREVTNGKAYYFSPLDEKQLLKLMTNVECRKDPGISAEMIERYNTHNTFEKYTDLINQFA